VSKETYYKLGRTPRGPVRMIASADFFATIRPLLNVQGALLSPDAADRLVKDLSCPGSLPPGNT